MSISLDKHLKLTYRLNDITCHFTSKPKFIDRIFEVLAVNESVGVHCCSATSTAECWPRGIVCTTNDKYNSEKHGEKLSDFEMDHSTAGDDVSYFGWSELHAMPVAEIQDFKDFAEDFRNLGHRDIDNSDMYTPYHWDLDEILGVKKSLSEVIEQVDQTERYSFVDEKGRTILLAISTPEAGTPKGYLVDDKEKWQDGQWLDPNRYDKK
jgi:hypothetical protein